MSNQQATRKLEGRDLREPERGGWPDNGRIEIVVDPNWLIDRSSNSTSSSRS